MRLAYEDLPSLRKDILWFTIYIRNGSCLWDLKTGVLISVNNNNISWTGFERELIYKTFPNPIYILCPKSHPTWQHDDVDWWPMCEAARCTHKRTGHRHLSPLCKWLHNGVRADCNIRGQSIWCKWEDGPRHLEREDLVRWNLTSGFKSAAKAAQKDWTSHGSQGQCTSATETNTSAT